MTPLVKFKSGENGQMGLHLHVASKSDSYLRACVQFNFYNCYPLQTSQPFYLKSDGNATCSW